MPDPVMIRFDCKAGLQQAVNTLELIAMNTVKNEQHFKAQGHCEKCGKYPAPVSYLAGWKCGDCFEEVSQSELGSAILTQPLFTDQARAAGRSRGEQDNEQVRLKGFRAQ